MGEGGEEGSGEGVAVAGAVEGEDPDKAKVRGGDVVGCEDRWGEGCGGEVEGVGNGEMAEGEAGSGIEGEKAGRAHAGC